MPVYKIDRMVKICGMAVVMILAAIAVWVAVRGTAITEADRRSAAVNIVEHWGDEPASGLFFAQGVKLIFAETRNTELTTEEASEWLAANGWKVRTRFDRDSRASHISGNKYSPYGILEISRGDKTLDIARFRLDVDVRTREVVSAVWTGETYSAEMITIH